MYQVSIGDIQFALSMKYWPDKPPSVTSMADFIEFYLYPEPIIVNATDRTFDFKNKWDKAKLELYCGI